MNKIDENTGLNISDKELAFDLRQVWVKLVGEQLNDLKESKKTNVYTNFFQEIEDLFDLVQQKFLKKEETTKKYLEKRTEVLKLANKNQQVWFGKNKNINVCSELNNQLRSMERLLYDSMEEANMYGARFDDEGL